MRHWIGCVVLVLNCCTAPHNRLDSVVETMPGAWPRMFCGGDEPSFTRLCTDSDSADLQLEYTGERKLISHQEGIQIPTHRNISELSDYFGSQDKKEFAVVALHKLAQIESVEETVLEINALLFSSGYQRVLVTGYRGFGREVYSDRVMAEQDAAFNPRQAS